MSSSSFSSTSTSSSLTSCGCMADKVQSTPAKGEHRSGHSNISAVEERAILPLPKATSNFIELFLVHDELPTLEWLEDALDKELQDIYQMKGEKPTYKPITRLMNRISLEAYKIYYQGTPSQIAREGLPSRDPLPPALIFVDSHKMTPPGNFFQTRVKPDVLAYWCDPEEILHTFSSHDVPITPKKTSTTTSRRGWSVVEAVLEAKAAKRKNDMQIVQYVDNVMQYRPDKSRVLSLTSNQRAFAFYTADACGAHCSEQLEWRKNLDHILRFIYTLYCRPHQDPSFPLKQPFLEEAQPSWELAFLEKRYRVSPFFARKGPGRRTWLALGTEVDSSEPRVVKDMWRDVGRRYEETAILDKIHRNGYVPGVVRVVASGPVLSQYQESLEGRTPLRKNPVQSNDSSPHVSSSSDRRQPRQKQRLIMGSTGSRLSSCKTVLHFLKVMYDTLEVHHHLAELGILHRDLSWYNVLCNPRHYIGTSNREFDGGRHYIGQILGEENHQPYCLITDFDNSSEIEGEQAINERSHRTGTAMFCSIDISGGMAVHRRLLKTIWDIRSTQFQLEGRTKELYLKQHGPDPYNSFNDHLDLVENNSLRKRDISDMGAILHSAVHDAESVFWIIMWFLMRASPTPKSEVITRDYIQAANGFLQHRMGAEMLSARSILITYEAEDWERILDPRCHSLIVMLVNMATYLGKRWLQYPDISPYHGHEAMKRLLLKEIVRMTDESDPIPINGPRPLPTEGDTTLPRFWPVSNTNTSVTGNSSTQVSSVGSRTSSKRPLDDPVEDRKPPKKTKCNVDEVKQWILELQQDRMWFDNNQ